MSSDKTPRILRDAERPWRDGPAERDHPNSYNDQGSSENAFSSTFLPISRTNLFEQSEQTNYGLVSNFLFRDEEKPIWDEEEDA
jgi:hypothetical protein